jgi:hypothetical protein
VHGAAVLSDLAAESLGIAKSVIHSVQDMLLKRALQTARDEYETRPRQAVELARVGGNQAAH